MVNNQQDQAPKIDGRTIEEFLRDPNPNGTFVGGPPLLNQINAGGFLKDPEGFEEKARAGMIEIFEPDTQPHDYQQNSP